MPSQPLPPDLPSRAELAAWLPPEMAIYFHTYDALQKHAHVTGDDLLDAMLVGSYAQFCRAAKLLHEKGIDIGGQTWRSYRDRYSRDEWSDYLDALQKEFSFTMTAHARTPAGKIQDLPIISACLTMDGCMRQLQQLKQLLLKSQINGPIRIDDVCAAVNLMKFIDITSIGMSLPQIARAGIGRLNARSSSKTGLPASDNLKIIGKLAYDVLHGPHAESCLKNGKIDRPFLAKMIKAKLKELDIAWRAPTTSERTTGAPQAAEKNRRERDWLREWVSRLLASIGDGPSAYDAYKDFDLSSIPDLYRFQYFSILIGKGALELERCAGDLPVAGWLARVVTEGKAPTETERAARKGV